MSDIKGKALSFGGINTRDLAPQVENLTLKGGGRGIRLSGQILRRDRQHPHAQRPIGRRVGHGTAGDGDALMCPVGAYKRRSPSCAGIYPLYLRLADKPYGLWGGNAVGGDRD